MQFSLYSAGFELLKKSWVRVSWIWYRLVDKSLHGPKRENERYLSIYLKYNTKSPSLISEMGSKHLYMSLGRCCSVLCLIMILAVDGGVSHSVPKFHRTVTDMCMSLSLPGVVQ